MLKCHAAAWSLRASPLNWALYCQREFSDLNHYSFVAMDCFDVTFLNDLEQRFEHQETVTLNSFDEFSKLLDFFSVGVSDEVMPKVDEVNCSWLLVDVPQPKDIADFDAFYEQWLVQTGRDNNMDEYGQLICLNGLFEKFSRASIMVVLSEAI
ncbi:hypothetical protein ACWAU4_12820 [Shewanella sp. FeAMO]|uniref:hypothetical protein n=2 Tax=Shewanella algae TaxID=38313 RepID=UPI001AAD4C5B|nr:hypothetical protein [Shewanella algae]QTE89143.1 hypothetical protein JKK33_11940 [Shewanella algae]